MPSDIYYQLRERLDQYSVGFPATASGVEIKILEKLFTEEEAQMFLNLSMTLETPNEVAERTNQDLEIVSNILDRMAKKGLIFRLRKDRSVKYAAVAFLYGIYEFQEKTLDRELAELMDEYFEEAFLRQMSEQTSIIRTIPVNRAIDISWTVTPYDDAREIIKSQDRIALTNCVCKVHKGMLDQGCDNPVEVCFYFGSNGKFFVDRGMARWISQEEALEIQDRCEEVGLVTQPDNSQRPMVMCHCCGDCCVMLRSLKKQPRPAEMVASNYYAKVDPELCEACETCLDRCQMEAITIGPEEVAVVNLDRCIGCGLCVTTCTAEALSLQQKPEEERQDEPPKPRDAMMQRAQKRGKTLNPFSFTKTL